LAGEINAGDFSNSKFAPGDCLWVRETWQALSFGDYQPTKHHVSDVRYAATDRMADVAADVRGYPWRPSIFMPRWASRLTLDVTAVRCERLSDISEADAKAEGAVFHDGGGIGNSGWRHDFKEVHDTARSSFARLWDDINGPKSFNRDQWVTVITFAAIEKNVDKIKMRAAA
jgi:hypothetical protein